MAGLRPARTCRDLDKVAWTRFSYKKPSKSYISSMPHTNLLNFRMGVQKPEYNVEYELVSKQPIQLRDNALEAGRQAANKYLEKTIPNNYYFHLRVICHHVIRENKMIAGAGADRLQKGMRHSFGRPTDRAARIKKNQAILSIKTLEENEKFVKEALRRMRLKISGKWTIRKKMIKDEQSGED
ncbi:MAG: 50S ribosomal protein L16 [Candidatus Anstonellaceae archaeon]